MAVLEVEVYQDQVTGRALDPSRLASLEHEIREHELVVQRRAATELGLKHVIGRCDHELARIRVARTIPFPLLTTEEVRIWRRFLPTTYTTGTADPYNRSPFKMEVYRFDIPPVSVLDTWLDAKQRKFFDVYEIWTPERPMPEPILLGYTTADKQSVGPFLLARWGESLEDFKVIRARVDGWASSPSLQQAQLQFFQAATQAIPAFATSGGTGSVSAPGWGLGSGLQGLLGNTASGSTTNG